MLRWLGWLLGFRAVRLVLAALAWLAGLGVLLGLALSGRHLGLDAPVPALALLAIGYLVGSLLSVGLWIWYRGWWQLGDPTLRRPLRLTPAQFEEAVADLLAAQGYRDVRRVGRSGDLGADILCRDSVGHLVIVQCKQYAPGRGIGSPTIQTFLGAMVIHRAQRGFVVTTATFTTPARAVARAQDIQLIDGHELSALLRGIHHLDQ